MNFKAFAFASLLGLCVPTIIDSTTSNRVVVADEFNYPTGSFADKEWLVKIYYHDNAYNYKGTYLPKGTGISLIGATTSGNYQRQVYSWRNGDLTYQVAWRPSQPDAIRVLVINNRGGVIFNRLLRKQ
jgi:hypothetical protein